MKNIVLAAAVLALLSTPAFAVSYSRTTPEAEAFTVDVTNGRASQQSATQQAQGSNWAPRGQQAQEQASEETNAAKPHAMKASGKPRHSRHNGAGHSPATGASKTTAPAAKH